MSQKGDGVDSKQALVTVDNEAKGDESMEKEFEMFQVFLLIHRCYEDVIQVDEDEVQIQEAPVHQPLHSLGRVLKSKRRTEVFKQTKRSDYCTLHDILLPDGDLVVPVHEVNLAENLLTS